MQPVAILGLLALQFTLSIVAIGNTAWQKYVLSTLANRESHE
jgi:hypothetical protein